MRWKCRTADTRGFEVRCRPQKGSDMTNIVHRANRRNRPRQGSEFLPVADHGGHKLEFEFVPRIKNAKKLYVLFDGRRIAYRSDTATWVSMVPGYEVIDRDYPDQVVVCWSDKVLQ